MKDPIIFAGYSRQNGAMKFRTATTELRIRQLERLDDEVYMIQIAPVYSKSAAAKELLRLDHMRGVKELERFYTAQVRDENPFRVVKIKVPSVAMVKLTGAQIEEQPLTAGEARKIRAEFNRQVKLAYEAN